MSRLFDRNGREIGLGKIVRFCDDEYEIHTVHRDGAVGLHPGYWSISRKKKLIFIPNLQVTINVRVSALMVTGWNDPGGQYSWRTEGPVLE